MKARFLHRRGAENAEASQREEKKRRRGGKADPSLLSLLLCAKPLRSIFSLLPAKPLRSIFSLLSARPLRLWGERDLLKHCLILPVILLPALLIALPIGEAQTQNGSNVQQDGSWNRRVAGAGDYQIVLEVSGRVEISRFFKSPDPLDLRSICEAKREAERRSILSSEGYLENLMQAADRRQFENRLAQLRNELGQLYAYGGEMKKSIEHFEAAYELIKSIAVSQPE